MKIEQEINKKLFVNVSKSKSYPSIDHNVKKKIEKPLPSQAHVMTFVGSPGAGKTSLMKSFLSAKSKNGLRQSYENLFGQIFVMCPTELDPMFNGIPDDQIYDDVNKENIEEIMERSTDFYNDNNKKECSLLIMDDVGSYLKKYQRIIGRLCQNHRHAGLSVWILVQKYSNIPSDTRACFKNLVIYRPPNNLEIETIFADITTLKKKSYIQLYNYLYGSIDDDSEDEHNFLFVDNGAKKKLYKNFDRLRLIDI